MSEFNPDSKPKALSHSSSKNLGCGCFAFVFFGMFFLIGSFGTFILGSEFIWPWLRTYGWTETPCTITQAELEPAGGLKLNFEYEFDNQLRTGNRYSPFGTDSLSHSDKEDFVSSFPVGAETTCLVNSDDPGMAVLRRSFNPEMFFALIPMVFALIGLAGMILGPKLARSMSPGSSFQTARNAGGDGPFQVESSLFSGLVSETQDWREPNVTQGPQELKPKDSPFKVLIVCLLFTTFWCGIVSIFVVQTVSDWMDGEEPWFQTLFMIPFVLIGLGGIGASIYCFLKLFNPVPKLVVSERMIPLGETIRMKWVVDGRVRSIRTFKIRLVGTEWIQYRRGTDTYTDTEDFYQKDLVELHDPLEMQVGEIDVTIPPDTMHSFHAHNNRIQWHLQVQGDIPTWPDIDQKFSITVLPHDSR